ncbi:FHA domain-containing protein [Actinoplanes sp. DH11]|uniref:FHA domain-containing protein n=1 Tax=Actinoplanes sp. DH11 TaxID=2857011 RepID=UPI001E3D9282|nr:FHA domain-containing protein [Actinoplanes sp. DH11]
MATLSCPVHGPQTAGGSMCPQPGCMEFLEPEVTPAEPVCPEPGCGNPLDPDGTCPLHNLGMAAEAAAYAGPAAAPGAGPAAPGARFELEFPFGPVPIDRGELRIGRSEDLGAIAASLSAYDRVSRKHAIVWVEDGALFVRDLGSTNGTFVNDRQVEDGSRRQLHEGDELRFASVLRARVRRAGAA